MADNVTISKTELLYDPLFDKKPDIKMKGRKNTTFKMIFIVVITIFVGLSLYFSFTSISSDEYTYKENYYIRCRLTDGRYAWSSPIWVE